VQRDSNKNIYKIKPAILQYQANCKIYEISEITTHFYYISVTFKLRTLKMVVQTETCSTAEYNKLTLAVKINTFVAHSTAIFLNPQKHDLIREREKNLTDP
jgi:hypothetical protein